MFNYIWPIALVVLSNSFYHICAKSVPEKMNPLASVIVTYIVGAVIALGLYYMTAKEPDILKEYRHLNWAPIALGLAIVGLEAGNIYAYKAGWPISVMNVVQGAVLAVILIFVGFLFYKEGITWNKIAGIFVCLGGLYLINMK